MIENIDPFDRVQLDYVTSSHCKSRSLSEAGCTRFAKPREERKSNNDTDRLRKHLTGVELNWDRTSRIP